jgi:uncharacterized membrane protein
MVIKVPSIRGGYVNFGDIAIFITAVILGKRAGFLAGSIGSALADIILGYTVYAPATFVIKGLEGLICGMLGYRKEGQAKISSLIFATVTSAAWMILGYFLFEYKVGGLLFANEDFGITAAVLNLPGNVVQGMVSAAAALPFIHAIKKSGISFNR